MTQRWQPRALDVADRTTAIDDDPTVEVEPPRGELVRTGAGPVTIGPDDDTLRIDPVTMLAVRTEELCAAAVDSFEIAAGLEADGVTDAVARERYGQPDVFALAEVLHAQVPRRPTAAERPANPWRSRATHHLLRGLLFGLPGLLYVSSTQLLARPHAVTVVLLSLLLSWSTSEALSYLGYVRLGQNDRPGAARVLRRGAVLAVATVFAVTVPVGLLLGVGEGPLLLAAAQTFYLLGATVLLVCGAERWLLAALLPGVAASAANLVWGAVVPLPLVWVAGAGSVLATVILAAVVVYWQQAASARRPTWAELRTAAPHALFGALAGGLLTFPTLSAIMGSSTSSQVAAITAIPLSVSMGAAEWLLFRFRRNAHDLLHRATTVRRFAIRARWSFGAAVIAYLVVLGVLADVTFRVATGPLAMVGLDRDHFWAGLTLGGALFAALALRSCGATRLVLGLGWGVLLGELAVVLWGPALGLHPDATRMHLMACAGLVVVFAGHALIVLGRATHHR